MLTVLLATSVTAAESIIPEGATCIPKKLRPTVGRESYEKGPLELQLALVQGTPTLCAHVKRRQDWDDASTPQLPVGTAGCWQINATRKRLSPVASLLLPGLPVHTDLVNGCAQGLCIPTGTTLPDDARPMIAINDTGDLAAILVFHDMSQSIAGYLFDPTTKTLLRTFVVDAQDLITRVVFIGDRIVAQHCKAAAHCSFRVFSTAAPASEPLSLTVKGKDFTNGHLGMLGILEPGVVGFADVGWSTFGRFDAKTTSVTIVRNKRPSACARKTMDATRVPACARKEVDPFADAYVIATGKTFLARLSAPRSGDIVTLDANLVERSRFNAYCAK
ncbi:MAG: hypothetical protein ACKV2T_08115 [Kofleriaceae bacterium]